MESFKYTPILVYRVVPKYNVFINYKTKMYI